LIEPALNGYIVKVGCGVVVIEGREKMVKELKRYLESPSEVEKEYLEKAVNELERPQALTATQAAGLGLGGLDVLAAQQEAYIRTGRR
jgi:hypothetical protein